MSGLTRQPPQAKYRGATGTKEHPWRKYQDKSKRKPVEMATRSEPFVCVSCGDLSCVGGECGGTWDR